MSLNRTLLFAGIYNILWAIVVIFFTEIPFQFIHIAIPSDIPLWQAFGLLIGMFGLGYILSAFNPNVHWPIVLIGLISKICGPLGFLFYATQGELSWSFAWLVFLNDVIWIFPFAIILRNAFDFNISEMERIYPRIGLVNKLHEIYTNKGESAYYLSENQKTLFIFLRHFGCTFCRKTLNELSYHRHGLEANGINIVIVHTADNETAEKYFAKYGLSDIQYITDSRGELYREFDIYRGTFTQLFGIHTLLKGLKHLLKYGIGTQQGDGFSMPGAFMVENGKILKSQHYNSAGDNLDWDSFEACKAGC
jgi:hypothetical protein